MTNPTGNFNGTIKYNSSLMQNGTVSAPAYSYQADNTTGWYYNASPVANVLSVGGIAVAQGTTTALQSLLDFIIQPVSSAVSYTDSAVDTYIGITSTSAARTVTLEPSPKNGTIKIVKDESGAAATHNITVNTSDSSTIDEASTYVISLNYGYAAFVFRGTNWNVFASGTTSPSSGTLISLTPDLNANGSAATAITGTAGNINVNGVNPIGGKVVETYNSANLATGNLEIANQAYLTPYVVDPSTTVGSKGTYTSIGAALSAATTNSYAGDIFIRPGTYTENPTLVAGVNLVAWNSDQTGAVIISGNCTFSSAGTANLVGIQLSTNAASALTISGSSASVVNLYGCNIAINTGVVGITVSSSSASSQVNLWNSYINCLSSSAQAFAMSGSGVLTLEHTGIYNGGGTSTASTISAGVVNLEYGHYSTPFTTSGSTAKLNVEWSAFDTSAQNVTCLNLNATTGAGSQPIKFSRFNSGSASAISIGASSNALADYLTISSSNVTAAITGSGTLVLGVITFEGTQSTINTTTVTSIITEIGQLSLNTPLSVSNGGTGDSSFTNTYGLIAAGTTTTGALQNIANVASGEVLTSNGTGALPIWSATPTLSGITLPAGGSSGTVTTNTMSFYEEGTWTPVLGSTSGTPSGFTYTTQTGVYQRIGNWVTAQFNIVVNGTVSNGTGNVRIKGLPYDGGTNVATGVVSLANITELAGTVYTLQTTSTAAYLDIATSTSVTAQGFLPISAVETTANPSIQGTITYHV